MPGLPDTTRRSAAGSAFWRRGEVGEVVEELRGLTKAGDEVLVEDDFGGVVECVLGQALAVVAARPGIPQGVGAGDERDDHGEEYVGHVRAVGPPVGRPWTPWLWVPPSATTTAVWSLIWPQTPVAGSVVRRDGGVDVDPSGTRGEVPEGGAVGPPGALELDPAVPLVVDRGGGPVVQPPQAGNLGGCLDQDGPDDLIHEEVGWREQGRQVREEAFIQGVRQRDGEGKEIEERVGARAGEDLDAALHLEDLSHGRVGWRDDPALGVAVGGLPAGGLGQDDGLGAGGVDGEGEPPGDVLDQVLVGVNLKFVVARGVPGTGVIRGGVHPEYRAWAQHIAGPSEAVGVADVQPFVGRVVEVVRHSSPREWWCCGCRDCGTLAAARASRTGRGTAPRRCRRIRRRRTGRASCWPPTSRGQPSRSHG